MYTLYWLLIFSIHLTNSYVAFYRLNLNRFIVNNNDKVKLTVLFSKSNSSKKRNKRNDLIQLNKLKANYSSTLSSLIEIDTKRKSNIDRDTSSYYHQNQDNNNKHSIISAISYLKLNMNTISSTTFVNLIYELSSSSNYDNSNGHNLKKHHHHTENLELTSLIIMILKRVSSQLTTYELSRLLVGMARIDMTWDKLNRIEPFMTQFMNLITNNHVHRHHHQQKQHHHQQQFHNSIELYIGDIIWSLGTMNARWDRFTSIDKNAMLQAISDSIHHMSSYSLSSTIWALAKMGKLLMMVVVTLMMMIVMMIMVVMIIHMMCSY